VALRLNAACKQSSSSTSRPYTISSISIHHHPLSISQIMGFASIVSPCRYFYMSGQSPHLVLLCWRRG
jgi:hypothetical protein